MSESTRRILHEVLGFRSFRGVREEVVDHVTQGKRMPDVPDVTGFDLAPDWVCEVVGRANAPREREGNHRDHAARFRGGQRSG